jgi:hypothetical protein
VGFPLYLTLYGPIMPQGQWGSQGDPWHCGRGGEIMDDKEKIIICLADIEKYLAKAAKSRAIQINSERALKEKIREVKTLLNGQ